MAFLVDISRGILRGSLILVLMASGMMGQMEINPNHKEITTVVGDEAILICSASQTYKVCSFRSPAGVTLHMWVDAAHEGGRLSEYSNSSNDCGLKISSIEEKDNGVWECSVSAVDENRSSTIIETEEIRVVVAVPPSSIQVYVDDEAVNSNILEIRLGENETFKTIKCVAVGARPAPTFTWMMGDEVINGETEDIEEDAEDGTKLYAQSLKYKPDIKHNGKELTCSLNHYGYTKQDEGDKKNQQSLKIMLLFKPREKAKEDVFYISEERDEKVLRMKFEAYPEPTEVFWTMEGLETPLAMGATSLDGKYQSSLLLSGDIPGEYSVQMTMNDIEPSDTNMMNSLTVSNDEGTTVYNFKLVLGSQPPPDENPVITHAGGHEGAEAMESSGSVVVIVIVIIVILVIIGLVAVARSKGILCFSAKDQEQLEGEKAAFDSVEKGQPLNPKSEPVISSPDKKLDQNTTTEAAAAAGGATEEKKSNGGANTPV